MASVELEKAASLARPLALQELMDSKDEMMAAVRDETMKNAELLMQAAKTRKVSRRC